MGVEFIGAVVVGLIAALPQILKLIERRVTVEGKRQHGLATIELEEAEQSMAEVDACGVSPNGTTPNK